MSRVPLLSDAEIAPNVTEIFDRMRKAGGRPPNLYRALANAPAMLEAWIGLAWPLRHEAKTSRALRELIIMRVAGLTGADYEAHHHHRMALEAGVSEAQLADLSRWRDSQRFSDTERAALAMADAVTQGGKLPDPVHDDLKRHFKPGEIVELVLTAAFYNCVSRTLLALEVPLES
jgi:4-carboxymuconolactone decarboxylase